MLAMGGPTQCHQCAPRGWRDVPDVTGDFDLDASILHRHNKDLPHRLEGISPEDAEFDGRVMTGAGGTTEREGETERETG